MVHPGAGEAAPAFRVNMADLLGAAARITGEGDDLAAGYLLSDNRIEAAQTGWVGSSAAALAARWETWLAASAVLLSRVGEHAQGLHNAVIRYAAAEAGGAAALHDADS